MDKEPDKPKVITVSIRIPLRCILMTRCRAMHPARNQQKVKADSCAPLCTRLGFSSIIVTVQSHTDFQKGRGAFLLASSF